MRGITSLCWVECFQYSVGFFGGNLGVLGGFCVGEERKGQKNDVMPDALIRTMQMFFVSRCYVISGSISSFLGYCSFSRCTSLTVSSPAKRKTWHGAFCTWTIKCEGTSRSQHSDPIWAFFSLATKFFVQQVVWSDINEDTLASNYRPCVTPFYLPVTVGFRKQRTGNAQSASSSWCHHVHHYRGVQGLLSFQHSLSQTDDVEIHPY